MSPSFQPVHQIFRAFRLWILAVLIFVVALNPDVAFTQQPLIETVPAKIEQVNKTVDFIDRVIGSAEGDDDVLIGARSKLFDLRPNIDSTMSPVRERLSTLNEAIAKIAPPADGVENEDTIVTEERARLTKERTELLVLTTRQDDLRSRIDTNLDRIATLRRDAFTTAITKRSPISFDLFSTLIQDVKTATVRIGATLSNWFSGLLAKDAGKLGFSAGLSLLIAFGFRWFTRNVIATEKVEEPTRFRLLFNALVRTLIPTIAIGLGALTFIGILTAFELYPISVEKILNPVLLAIISYFFVTALTSNIFSPDNAEMRLVPFSRYAASRISFLIICLASIQVFDYIISNLAKAANAPLTVTIANSFVAALLIGLTLMALLLVRKDKGTPERAVPRWLRIPILVVSIGIIGVAFAGYVGLSRFVAQQIVISGAILVTIYLALTTSRELGQPGGLGATRLGGWLTNSRQMEAERIDQYGLAIGLALMALTLILGIPALALQWGSRIEDIWNIATRLFLGFDIGSFSFSLGNILFGLFVFCLIFFITRLFQRWLSSSVLSRTRADIGVRNSITTGVGYTGMAIAFLMGVTAAGFNLASLAIVAGALSLGIGFGLQNVVSNFVSGLILLVERPIKVGDFIETGSHKGTIKKISVRATELETIHRMSVIVPNSELINSSVGNWTHKIKNGRIDLPIGVAYGTDYKHVREILLECASLQKEIMSFPEPFVFFRGFGESSVDFELRVHLRDWTLNPVIQSALLFDICEAFAKHNIEIPFPQRDLNIRTVDEAAARALTGSSGKTTDIKEAPKKSPGKSSKPMSAPK